MYHTLTNLAAALGEPLAACLLVIVIQVIFIRSLWIKKVSNRTVNITVNTVNFTVRSETDE